MIACILTAILLGLFSGLAPGPVTAMVAVTGMERGFRAAVPFAMAPLITDLVPMLASTTIISRLDWGALTALGLGGGVIVAMVGIRLVRSGPVGGAEADHPPPLHVGHALATSAINAAPWVFWFVAAAPLMLSHAAVSPIRGPIFIGVLFVTNGTSALTLGWLAGRAGLLMESSTRSRVSVVAGAFLVCVGVAIVWQALEGNFQALVAGNDALRARMGG